MAQDKLPWLIKSSGRILGPFPTDKVGDLLRTREISVLDEIATPMRRWQTIQYHEEFKDIIDKLRRQQVSDKTEATWTPTGTAGLTQTVTDVGEADLTAELTPDLESFQGRGREIVIQNVPEQVQTPPPVATGRFQPQQSQNAAIQQKVDRTTRGLWLVTLIVLTVAGLFAYRQHKSGAGSSSNFQSLKQNVISLVQVGHYAEALKELKAYYTDPDQAGELSIYYGSLLIQVENQTVLGRRLLHSVINGRRPEIKQAYSGLGMADLIDGQLDAAEGNFDKAISLDRDYVPAIVNLAAVALQKGEYSKAKAQALRALKLSPHQGEALLMLAEAQLYLFKADKNVGQLNEVGQTIRQFRSRQWDFAPELGFYSLYFDFLRRERFLEDKILTYLDMDPRLTLDHRHNVFIYSGRNQWRVMSRYCEQMVDQLGEGAKATALLAACYAHEGRWSTALRAVEKAVNQSPKDPLIQAWYSYILRESGDADQASVVLSRAMELNRRGQYVLPMLMQARFSQSNNDVDGARRAWQSIYERNTEYLPAVAGLAWAQLHGKTPGEGQKMVEKGLGISPDYIPLLVLRQRGDDRAR